jgi:hypothetical protein
MDIFYALFCGNADSAKPNISMMKKDLVSAAASYVLPAV